MNLVYIPALRKNVIELIAVNVHPGFLMNWSVSTSARAITESVDEKGDAKLVTALVVGCRSVKRIGVSVVTLV